MLDFGLATPVDMSGVTTRDADVNDTAWDTVLIPNDASGNPAKFVMVSWRIPDTAAPVHLHVLVHNGAAGSTPADGVPVFHGLAHNPIILDVSGASKISFITVAGSTYASVSAIGNQSAGCAERSIGPLQIAADSIPLEADNGTQTVTLDTVLDSTGEKAKYVLVAWEERDAALRLTQYSLSSGHPYFHGNAHNPIIMDARGVIHWRYQAESGKTAQVHLTPLENG